MVRFRIPKSVEELAEWYMRYVSPLSLIAGFIADSLFLARRVDLLLTNVLLFSYLVVAALGILIINLIQTGRLRHPFYLKALPLLPVVAQFAFGGLFSAYLALYSKSAAISVSWIFIVALVVLIIGNERFAHFYARFSVQVSLYFTVLFSFLIFFLPVIFHRIGPWMFLLSGAVALAVVGALLAGLFKLMPDMLERRTKAARAIATIYVVFNILYFTGAIPPLPLALKDAGVYHGVDRAQGGGYTLSGEPIPWYDIFTRYNTVFHAVSGDTAYVYTSIFAPSGLSTVILHEWQRYDETAGKWVTVAKIGFPIYGGRDGGYRGYSLKSNIAPGEWRVDVVTQYGQLIGRVAFTTEAVSENPTLVEITR
ncbi:MAG: DUF2914 domain-containing protein [Patescibacteria group bacterium]|nr:DUF2914 domain-containing protein [bacterium]MDZ4227424.1 DUF2914 domain-containing protein [Patescibacteria group bacterium]